MRRLSLVLCIVSSLIVVGCDSPLVSAAATLSKQLVGEEPAREQVTVDVLFDGTASIVTVSVVDSVARAAMQGIHAGGMVRVWVTGGEIAREIVAVRYTPARAVSARARRRAWSEFVAKSQASLHGVTVAALRDRPSDSRLAEAVAVIATADAVGRREIWLVTDYIENSPTGRFARTLPAPTVWTAQLARERVLYPDRLRGITVRCLYFAPRDSLRHYEVLRDLWRAALEGSGAVVIFSSSAPNTPAVPPPVGLMLIAPLLPVAVWRVRSRARQHAFRGLPNQCDATVTSILGVAPSVQSLIGGQTRSDLSEYRSAVLQARQRLDAYWSWLVEVVAILLFAGVDGRSCARIFFLLGMNAVDALFFGFALAIILVAATWFLVSAISMEYDGTMKRTVRRALAVSVYIGLAGAMVAVRVALVDPGEESVVRWGSAILILASTLGPSLALEILVRRAFTYVPLLVQLARARATLREAQEYAIGTDRSTQRVRRSVERWNYHASKIRAEYDLAYNDMRAVREQRR
jgi:hypothetical protein